MTGIRIVPLGGTHLPHVAQIEKRSFSAPWSQTSLELLLTGENGGFAALDGDCVIGYIGYLGVIDEYEITNVAVDPDFRRQGIGAALVGALLERARESDILRVTLDVRPSNSPAIALYQAFGFTPCGTRKNFYSHPREDATVMELLTNKQ